MYTVYLVDDEKLMVESVVSSVNWTDNGFEVVGYNTDPSYAKGEILSLKPDLIISDLKMPRLDGIELIKALKEAGADFEVIMLSAFAEFEASRHFFLLGGMDYLLKPLDLSEATIVLEQVARKIAAKTSGEKPRTELISTGVRSFDELVSYVAENFAKKISLESLSRQFGLSPTYICSLFSKHYSCTMTIFLTNIRMREAVKMLTETKYPLKEVAMLSGYTDYYYFCRVFKLFYGIAPTLYLKQRELR